MTKNRTWIGMAFALVLVLAIGLATSCYSDATSPKYVPPQPDTPTDTTKGQG